MADDPRILLVDSYDSFTFNLAALCRQAIPNAHIHIIKNDAFTISQLLPHLKFFSAVVVGPGPGSPEIPEDIGVVKDLWKLSDESLLPIFGVCLGLQSLAIEYGSRLKRLNIPKHGQLSRINHQGTEIFKGVGETNAVRYHSLHVELAQGGDVEQLAWTDDGLENGRVVMAARHRSKPFWAVQYHPESVCTDGGGLEVMINFWDLAQRWSLRTKRDASHWNGASANIFGCPWPPPKNEPPPSVYPDIPVSRTVVTSVLELPDLTACHICELFGVSQKTSPFVLLDSAAQPGRFSIIASLMPASARITHFAGETCVFVTQGKSCEREDLGLDDVWSWLSSYMAARQARNGSPEIPFWGGLVGYLSYELGVHTLPVPPKEQHSDETRCPDLSFVFVERSMVVDSVTGKVFVQSILPGDGEWIADTRLRLKMASNVTRDVVEATSKRRRTMPSSPPTVTLPDKQKYISRIELAKEHLFAGESYELCLTARTHVTVPTIPPAHDAGWSTSWDLYKSLRSNNPAPYSAYLRLGRTTLLSSSPERFLSFSRPPKTLCQLRPIKGTVRKGPSVTRAVAEMALAGSKKEMAENLMIVDLIRHDLHRVVGEDVQVKQFCVVEEYETVWQLVSVIEGRSVTKESRLVPAGQLGWEVLKKSLPPGSMTGAPKKRSVEILQTLEDDDRGIYSGVFGYWCVGGGGDWAVTIRSCFKHDVCSEGESEVDEWVLGAGGAITALSEPEAEWDEMVLKLQSVMRSFGVTLPISSGETEIFSHPTPASDTTPII